MRQSTKTFLYLVALAIIAISCNDKNTAPYLKLWYKQPATEWSEALPIGNGRLGAMVYGGVDKERLQLNEETLWSGGPHSYDNPDAFQHLAEVRELLEQGKLH
jgi:alpha-L-fucosidase 2